MGKNVSVTGRKASTGNRRSHALNLLNVDGTLTFKKLES